MSDPLPWIAALALSLPLVVLAVIDVDTARELRRANRMPPTIELLQLLKQVIYGVTAAAVLSAALGIHTIVFLATGMRLIPQPLPFLMIYAICVVASLMVYRLRRWIRSQ